MTLFGSICIMNVKEGKTYTITQVLNSNQYAAVNDKTDGVLIYPTLVLAIEEIEKLCAN